MNFLRKKGVFSGKAQFSIEYLIMMGFTLLLIIPTIIIFANESTNIKSDIALSQINKVALKLSEKAEEVYYQGAPSRTTIRTNLPSGIENISISGKDIVFIYSGYGNSTITVIETAQVNVTGNISIRQGVHNILIKSEGDYVSITET